MPLHWDNALVHIAALVKEWFAANAVQVLEHPSYSQYLAPADIFLFRKVKGPPGASLTRTLPPPSSGGTSPVKSVFASAADTLRNLKK
jgi:hypothetical protein